MVHHMTDSTWQAWFERSWEIREESVYTSLFGSTGPGIYKLDAELFTVDFGQKTLDPRWLYYGVFECPPTDRRPTWLYVSSGLSNAWDDDSPNPDQWSGLGCEFTLQAREQSSWALFLLRRIVAFQILLAHGRFKDRKPLELWDRIPLQLPIDGHLSCLTWLLVAKPMDFPPDHQLPSGRFEFFQLVGITEKEAAYARKNGGQRLLKRLSQRGFGSITDPARECVLRNP